MEAKRILIGNVPQHITDSTRDFFSRAHFDVDYLPSALAVNSLVQKIQFDILLLGIPIDGLRIEDLFHVIRKENMPCIHSPVLLIGEEEILDGHKKYIGKGASAIIPSSIATSELGNLIGNLLSVAPRIDTRLMIKMRVHMESREGILLCQCANISSSGMLIRTSIRYDIGSTCTLEFTLPGDTDPIRCEAVAMRHTIHGRDSASGIGVKFSSFEGDGEQRLISYLENLA